VRELRCNVLVEGENAVTKAVLRLLLATAREPVAWHQPYARLELPDGGTNTFVLRNVAALSANDQARLLDWSGDTHGRTQIISTSASPLFTLVECGLFDAELYYRLNIMLLRLGFSEPGPINRSGSCP
jgi:transcriptional regulator of acetoin/glycerol metabolism